MYLCFNIINKHVSNTAMMHVDHQIINMLLIVRTQNQEKELLAKPVEKSWSWLGDKSARRGGGVMN